MTWFNTGTCLWVPNLQIALSMAWLLGVTGMGKLWPPAGNTLDEDGMTLREKSEGPFGCPHQL